MKQNTPGDGKVALKLPPLVGGAGEHVVELHSTAWMLKLMIDDSEIRCARQQLESLLPASQHKKEVRSEVLKDTLFAHSEDDN